jgi:serine/threonine-protein kinase
MAELFLARRQEGDELVVIKRILPHLTGEAEFVGMFLDEARIAAQLHHPNIVQVHELGRMERALFLAMEYVEGIDLRKIFRREAKRGSAVPYRVAAKIVAEVCRGLHYAHNALGVDGKPLKVVHRDVSPQNVMVAYDGRVKLVDFGIAKAGALVERSKPGIIKGKFLYLSPEQVAQEKVDHRADLFALGTMLYEVTTGRSPFQKPSTEAVIYAIKAENPRPPHEVRADFPPELERIVLRCLLKDREQRYTSAAEVQAELEQFLKTEGGLSAAGVVEYVNGLLGSANERTVVHLPDSSELAASPQPPPLPADANPFPSERETTDTGEVRDVETTPGRAPAGPTVPRAGLSVPTLPVPAPPTAPLPVPPPSPTEGRRPTASALPFVKQTTREVDRAEVEAAVEALLSEDDEDSIDTGNFKEDFTDEAELAPPVAEPAARASTRGAQMGLFGRLAEGILNTLHRLVVGTGSDSSEPPEPPGPS